MIFRGSKTKALVKKTIGFFACISPIFFIGFEAGLAEEVKKVKINCDSPVFRETEQCKEENRWQEIIDSETGLNVIEFDKDIDWKKKNVKLPWSKITKYKSLLTGSYELTIFDRDYKADFSTGAIRSLNTRWTVNELSGYLFTNGGCGFWVCTYEGPGWHEFQQVEIFSGERNFKLFGSNGKFSLPYGFINYIKESKEGTTIRLKVSGLPNGQSSRGFGDVFVPIGEETVKSLQLLFKKGAKNFNKPTFNISRQNVSKSKLDVEDIASITLPSVVMIKGESGLGSGFFVDDKGLILTNRHVVAGDDKEHIITGDDGIIDKAKVIYIDRQLDFALLQSQSLDVTKPLPLCFADYPRPGQNVVALGSPLGLAGTVTRGIVSAVRQPSSQLEDVVPTFVTLVQTDAAISGGNSGGPLVNSTGEVVGVNTWSIHGRDGRAQNLNFAISIVDILKALEVKAPSKISSVNRCGNLQPKIGNFMLLTIAGVIVLLLTVVLDWKGKKIDLFKRVDYAQTEFKRWLLKKLIPYIEETKKEEKGEKK